MTKLARGSAPPKTNVGDVVGSLRVVDNQIKKDSSRCRTIMVECLSCNRDPYRIREWQFLNGKSGMCSYCSLREAGVKRRMPDNQVVFNKHMNEYVQNARSRGLVFSLTPSEFSSLVVKDCFYCGAPPSREVTDRRGRCSLTLNGIDRFVNSLGYTLENSVPCCTICNRTKWNLDGADFLDLVHRIASCHPAGRR